MLSHVGVLLVVYALCPCFAVPSRSSPSCRCLPGDSCWPDAQEWTTLNATVGGRLIATIPLASPCHDPDFDGTECSLLKTGWTYPQIHFASSSSIIDPYAQNRSCDPFTSKSKPCLLGNYVDYAINVTSANDVAAGLQFAQKQNIRLVIKNTGHDYSGKSTGKGALGLWTHNLKSISFRSYNSIEHTGPAIKMEAGVQGYEAYAAANAQGLRVVGGECPTVGLVGGYTQGGGHSALSSTHGLGADQTLEWEVVTANGTLVTASQTQNTDLYWALSGGGGGTYGVVLSLTAKAHPDGPVGGAKLSFTSTNISEENYWAAIAAWHAGLPALVDSGTMTLYLIEAAAFTIEAITAPNHSIASVYALLQPFTTILAGLNISYVQNITSFPTYYQHFNSYFGPLPFGSWPAALLVGGRLLPRSVVETSNDALTTAVRNITRDGKFQFSGIAVNASHAAAGNKPGSNAVLPAWRDALISALTPGAWNFSAPLAVNHAAERTLTEIIVPQLEALSPGSGCYMNEANFRQPNWQEDFYGSNYEALRAIKKKYDPEDLFYATTAVGSEAWVMEGDGRLCRV